jgi:thiamine biosynthesis lipoprotein
VTDPAAVLRHAEPVMGTVASFVVHPGPLSPAQAAGGIALACRLLQEADRVFSLWAEDSPMARLRRGQTSLGALPGPVAAEIGQVLAWCEAARHGSGGWFDPWAMPGGVDPTGLVKGWAVERAVRSLAEAGCAAVLVNAGGDVMATGCPPGQDCWRVGIRHPWRSDALSAVVRADAAVATSGSYERGLHLTDPHTRLPVHRTASASVTGPSLALADAYATGLAVAGEPGLVPLATNPGYEGYLIGLDGRESNTPGFPFLSADG